MTTTPKEGVSLTPLTDEALLKRLRGPSGSISHGTRNEAADRIEEYCTDAAVAEEALLRVYTAAGGLIDELPEEGSTIEYMVTRCISRLDGISKEPNVNLEAAQAVAKDYYDRWQQGVSYAELLSGLLRRARPHVGPNGLVEEIDAALAKNPTAAVHNAVDTDSRAGQPQVGGGAAVGPNKPKWKSLADFIHNATEDEKREVYEVVMERASARQRTALTGVLPVGAAPVPVAPTVGPDFVEAVLGRGVGNLGQADYDAYSRMAVNRYARILAVVRLDTKESSQGGAP